MTSKTSSERVSPSKKIGDDLNYSLVYNYDKDFAHRLVNVGNRYYQYDANGNIVCEKDGSFDEETVSYSRTVNQEAENVYSTDYGWGLYAEDSDTKSAATAYKRTYAWNEKNQLISSVDASYSTAYVYGQDGQRTNKYTVSSETVYFNKMWTLHTDSGNSVYGGQSAKNIYLGDTRIVTKLNSGDNPTYQEEFYKRYYYHSDHLGSASLISDYRGDEYQRLEYTPYGEIWVEKTSNIGNEFLPYKFTGKEMDEETGLYYYGARYLDPKYSLWISTDPALGDYIPAAGKANSKDAASLPGMGGAFNHINFNLYHYAGNNPVRYTDPNGCWIDNEDGTFTAEEGDTLYDLYGDDWQNKSGFKRDPTTLQIGETVGKKLEYHDLWESVNPNSESTPSISEVEYGQIIVGINLNFVAMIGFDISVGLLFNLDDISKSGMLLSGGFAAGVSAGLSLFCGYNFGSIDAKNLGTISIGYGPIGANVGIDSNTDISLNGSYSPIGIDAGFNFSKQHSTILPFATEEEKNKMMEKYYEHH